MAIGEFNASERKQVVLGVGHELRSLLVAMKPKVDFCHLAADLLSQAGTDRQVFGCGESSKNSGLVGKIAVFTLGFGQLCFGNFQLRFVAPNLAFQLLRATAGDERLNKASTWIPASDRVMESCSSAISSSLFLILSVSATSTSRFRLTLWNFRRMAL